MKPGERNIPDMTNIKEIRSVAENSVWLAMRLADIPASGSIGSVVTIVLASIQVEQAAAGRVWDGDYDDAMDRIASLIAEMPTPERQAISESDTLPVWLTTAIRDIVLECTFVLDGSPAPGPMTVWEALTWALAWLDRDPSMDPDWQAARNNAADYVFQFRDGSVTVGALVAPLEWALTEIEERTNAEADNTPEFPTMMGRACEALRRVKGGAK